MELSWVTADDIYYEVRLLLFGNPSPFVSAPPAQYHTLHSATQALDQVNGKIKRSLFYNVPYTAQEQDQIARFRDFASKSLDLDCSDQHVLRYLYSTDFNHKDCL